MMNVVSIVSGVIQQDNRIVLCLRKNTKYRPGYWALPVGHVEADENTIDALRRELFEELGIQMLDGEMLTTLFDNEQNIQHTVYRVTEWRGEIENREPDLCAQVTWCSLDELPFPLAPATETILKSL